LPNITGVSAALAVSQCAPGLEIVTDNDPASQAPPVDGRRDLMLRIVSALVLAPLAIAIAYLGGTVFVLFWGLAAAGIQWEWRRMVGDVRPLTLGLGFGAILFATADIARGGAAAAMVGVAVVCVFAALAALVAHKHRRWIAGGILYSSSLVLSVGVLRADREWGYWAVLYLFAIVWATDILGFFVGRLVGGPKLAPRLSPNKTWSGALGGVVGAVLAGVAVTGYAGISNLPAAVSLGLVLSAVSQVGDLFESAVKRRFGAKDAGHVIPGHGGFMDRLDGFLAAAFAAAIIGLARGGFDAPARGLLAW
jgi:phosphatidate cytidylyltransferase